MMKLLELLMIIFLEAKKKKAEKEKDKPRIWTIFGQIFNEMDDTNV